MDSGAAARPSMPDMNGDAHGPIIRPTPTRGGADPSARGPDGRAAGSSCATGSPEERGAGATDFLGELVARNDGLPHRRHEDGTGQAHPCRGHRRQGRAAAASRPGRAHERISADDLERIMAKGWAAVDRGGLGDWAAARRRRIHRARELRSRRGRPEPARSTRPSTSSRSGTPTAAARRSSRCTASAASPSRAPGRRGPAGRGYAVGGGRADWQRVLVMTGLLGGRPAADRGSRCRSSPTPSCSMDWLMAYAEQRSVVPGVTEAVLTGSDGQLFLSVRDRQPPHRRRGPHGDPPGLGRHLRPLGASRPPPRGTGDDARLGGRAWWRARTTCRRSTCRSRATTPPAWRSGRASASPCTTSTPTSPPTPDRPDRAGITGCYGLACGVVQMMWSSGM